MPADNAHDDCEVRFVGHDVSHPRAEKYLGWPLLFLLGARPA
jgi:hypothetical protein